MATTISGSSNSSFGGTIDAGSEHLTLNAVGAGKAVKLQNNGTTAVEISNGATYIKGSVYPEVSLKMNDSKAITFGTASDVEMLGDSLGTDINIKDNRLRIRNNLTELVRFPSTGGITFNGDTAAANALDDYEEGTWTPTCSTATISINQATYTKIGRLVHVFTYVVLAADGNGSVASLSGLPFSIPGNNYEPSVVQISTNSAGRPIVGRAEAATDRIILFWADQTQTGVPTINIDNGHWMISQTYHVA